MIGCNKPMNQGDSSLVPSDSPGWCHLSCQSNGDATQLAHWVLYCGIQAEDVKRLARALFFDADSLSEKIIENYQRYIIRKGL